MQSRRRRIERAPTTRARGRTMTGAEQRGAATPSSRGARKQRRVAMPGPRMFTIIIVWRPVRPTTAPASAITPPATFARSGGVAAAMSSSVPVARVPGAA